MQIVLPCRNSLLRSRTTQKEHSKTNPCEFLPACLETQIAQHLASEVDLLLRLEQLKKDLVTLQGFDPRVLFRAITDKAFIDEKDVRRFLKRLGHQPSKQELTNIMRRFDLTGNN